MPKFLGKILIAFLAIGIFVMPIVPDISKKLDGNFSSLFKVQKAAAVTYHGTGSAAHDLWLLPNNIATNNASFGLQVTTNDVAHFTDATIVLRLFDSLAAVNAHVDGSTTVVPEVEVPIVASGGTAGEIDATLTSQNRMVELTDTLTSGQQYFAIVDWNDASNGVADNIVASSNVVSFTFGQAASVNNNAVPTPDNSLATGNFSGANANDGPMGMDEAEASAKTDEDFFGCGVDSWRAMGGCIAQFFFFVIWTPVSLIAHLAGSIFDYFIDYSTASASYGIGGFVNVGWASVRDIANILFIIGLLVVAVQTILGIGHNGKKMIATIIVVALLINFSLFFTRVIIDATNILAKVFYNNITVKTAGTGGQTAQVVLDNSGTQKISEFIMNGFNPQTFLSTSTYKESGMSLGKFIFILLIAAAVVIYTAYIFFSVAILFASRVAMLALLMVFAPIAFASYVIPINIPGIGHKDWWESLWKNAFLAPIFMFMLFVIATLITGLRSVNFVNSYDTGTVATLMNTMVPFLIIVILIKKAKELAVKYSGEMGAAFMKVDRAITGAGLAVAGMATGGALRATVGRVGSAVANSGAVKDFAAKNRWGRTLLNVSESASKGSFDFRGSAIGGKALAGAGISAGKAQSGGYEKVRADKTEARLKRAKQLEVGEDEKLNKDVREKELAVQDAKNEHQEAIATQEKALKDKKAEIADMSIPISDASNDAREKEKALKEAEQKQKEAERKVADAEARVANATPENRETELANARTAAEAARTAEANANTARTQFETAKGVKDGLVNARKDKLAEIEGEGGIKELLAAAKAPVEAAETALKHAQHAKHEKGVERRNAFADSLDPSMNKGGKTNAVLNFFSSGFQSSPNGRREAIHKIRMGVKPQNKPEAHDDHAAPHAAAHDDHHDDHHDDAHADDHHDDAHTDDHHDDGGHPPVH